MVGGRKAGHVDADLADEHLGGALGDPGIVRSRPTCSANGATSWSISPSSRPIIPLRWSMCSRCIRASSA